MPMLTTLRMRLPVWPFQAPLRTRSAKAAIRSSTACTPGTTFSPSTRIVGAARRAQRDVQHGAVLGDVDLLAAEHRVDALAQPRLLRQRQQQAQRLVGDAVLRVVEVDAGGLERRGARRAAGRRRRARAGAAPSAWVHGPAAPSRRQSRSSGLMRGFLSMGSCAALGPCWRRPATGGSRRRRRWRCRRRGSPAAASSAAARCRRPARRRRAAARPAAARPRRPRAGATCCRPSRRSACSPT